jgi:hypothetical protein
MHNFLKKDHTGFFYLKPQKLEYAASVTGTVCKSGSSLPTYLLKDSAKDK